MPLVDFRWEDEPQDIEDFGPCFVAIAREEHTQQWYRIAISLKELEDAANRKAVSYEQRKH